jgi:hypothetical protein
MKLIVENRTICSIVPLYIWKGKTMNIRTVILFVALALGFLFAAPLVIAEPKVVSEALNEPASVLAAPEPRSDQNNAPVPSYRSQLGECFDVPVSELASCQNANQAPVSSYRSRIDECFDVPVSELASCRNGYQAPAP